MKYVWIEEHRDQFHVTRMCRQLEVSRTGYSQWRTRAPSDRSMANATLDAQVAAIHAESHRSYGRPRIVQGLRVICRRNGAGVCRHIGASIWGGERHPGDG